MVTTRSKFHTSMNNRLNLQNLLPDRLRQFSSTFVTKPKPLHHSENLVRSTGDLTRSMAYDVNKATTSGDKESVGKTTVELRARCLKDEIAVRRDIRNMRQTLLAKPLPMDDNCSRREVSRALTQGSFASQGRGCHDDMKSLVYERKNPGGTGIENPRHVSFRQSDRPSTYKSAYLDALRSGESFNHLWGRLQLSCKWG
jgi:hypothetical protein